MKSDDILEFKGKHFAEKDPEGQNFQRNSRRFRERRPISQKTWFFRDVCPAGVTSSETPLSLVKEKNTSPLRKVLNPFIGFILRSFLRRTPPRMLVFWNLR